MNITKTIQEKTTILLRIELLPEELRPYLERAVKRISTALKIPGFRPGHAPYDIVKKHVAEMEIYQEAVDDVVKDTLPTAVQREQVDFVGKPQVAVETLAPNNPLVYTATFSLMPAVQLNNYKMIKVAKPAVTVDEQKVEKTLQQLRKLRSQTQTADKAAATGDQAMIDFNLTLAGVPFEGGQGKDVAVVLGDNEFIPGFEEHLQGAKAGETKNFKVTFPQDYPAKHLAGKECDATVTIKTISTVTVPSLDDAFAKEFNFESVKDLTTKVRANIQQELENKADAEFEAKVIEQAVAQATFDPIPVPMIEFEIDRMIDEMRERVEYEGGKMEDYLQHIKKTEQELRASWKEQAVKRVQGALLIKTVAEQENITVPEEAIDQEINRRKQTMNKEAEEQPQLDSLEYRGYVRSLLRNQKAVEKLKQHVTNSALSK